MPTSPRPYQNQYRKDSKTQDVFRKRREMVLEKDISDHNREQLKLWVSFWRRNIHRFIIDVMGVDLFPYQIIWVYLMQVSPLFVAICSRTASKSFLVAAFTVARCILYPNLSVIVAATTIKQAGLIVSKKVAWLRDNSPIVQAEIKNLTANNNLYEVTFHNGSIITVVAANEGALGNRCNDLIIDEFAVANKDCVDKILKPFLFPRQIPFSKKPEYRHIIEPIRTCYISSAGYATDWWYKTTLFVISEMIKGKQAGFFATDYLSSLKHNLKTRDQIEEEKKENAAFDMQYGNIPARANENSYYQMGMFKRNIKKAFYPMRKQDYPLKKNPFAIPKIEGEVRVLGLDLAVRSSKSNDNSVTSAIRLLPSKKGYERQLVYMESSHGANHSVQANRIKDIWYDFQADFIAMDMGNIGASVFEDLGTAYYNEERGVQMPAFTVMDHNSISKQVREELKEKTLGSNALPIIYPVSATAELNTEMHVAFRSALQKKMWKFLVDDVEGEDFLSKNIKEYFNMADDGIKAFLLHPYVQTNLFILEALNLEMKIVSSNIKLEEGSGRKDRYSSVLYANFLSSLFDKELLKEDDFKDEWEILMGVTQFI